MKCGEIWARSALISASISRVRDWSRSANSSWTLTQRATSPAARTRTADSRGAQATRAPWTRSSTVSGATTAQRTGQSGASQVSGKASPRPVSSGPARRSMISVRWWLPTPSQTRTCFWSVRHSASVPSSERSLRADLRAVSSVSPARSGGAAREAVCRVSKVACSTGVPRPPRVCGRAVRRPSQNPAARSGRIATHSPARNPLMPSPASCLYLRPQFLRQVEAGQDRRRARRYPARGGQGHQHHGEEAERYRPERGPGEQGVLRAVGREAGHGRGHGEERGAAADQHARGGAGRGQPPPPDAEHEQRAEGGRGDGEGESDRVGDGQSADQDARGQRDAHREDRAEPEVPYAARGQDVLGEHAGHGHGESGGRRKERGEGPARNQRPQQGAAEAADHPLREQQDGGVGVSAEGEFGGVQAAEGAVDRGQEVEAADQAEDG